MNESWLGGRSSYHATELDRIAIRAKIGVAPFERHEGHFQRLTVSVVLYRRGRELPVQDLSACMDYDRIYRHVMGWEQRPHTDLLETLIEELVGVCFEDATVEACQVSLRKPDIYHNVRGAAVTFHRWRTEPDAAE